MRIVVVTQAVDSDDPILGATVAMLRALAARCDELFVLCDRVGTHDLPGNASFATFAARTRFRRGLRFLTGLIPLLLRRPRPDAIVAHMCPIYAVLAAPLARPLRVPVLLWYTHWTIDRTLKLATRLCQAGLSVDARSYPLDSSKVRGIGHGIDTAEFAVRSEAPDGDGRLKLLALGRTSPSKGLPTLLKALELTGPALDATLELRGPTTTAVERQHRAELEAAVRSASLDGRVRLEGPVPRGQVPELIRRFDAVVSSTKGQSRGGALDKAVFESAACGVPVIACNPHFDRFLGDLPLELRFQCGDAEDLARVLTAFAQSTQEQRTRVAGELRRRVESEHSVDSWADGVIRVIQGVRGKAP